MATRIKDLTEDTTPIAGDSAVIDSTADGTRRTLLSSIATLFATLLAGVGLEAAAGLIRAKAELRRETYKYVLETDAGASTAKAKRAFQRIGAAGSITGIFFNASSTHAGNDTNNFQLTIRRQLADGTNELTVCDFVNNVANGGVTALVTKDLTSLGANLTGFVAGDVLTYQITKNGSGQAVNGLSFYVIFEITG